MDSSFFHSINSNFAEILKNAVTLAFFVLGAIGSYQLAKSRGYDKPWLACIPVANSWVIGWICDDIARLQGQRTSYRKILLGLSIGLSASVIPILVFFFSALFSLGFSRGHWWNVLEQSVGWIIGMVFLMLAVLAAAVCRVVFTIKAVYRIYKDYVPENAVLYAVLSCILSLYYVFLFVIRGKTSNSLYWASRPEGYSPSGNGFAPAAPAGPAPQPSYPPQGYYGTPPSGPAQQPPYPPQSYYGTLPSGPAQQPPYPPQSYYGTPSSGPAPQPPYPPQGYYGTPPSAPAQQPSYPPQGYYGTPPSGPAPQPPYPPQGYYGTPPSAPAQPPPYPQQGYYGAPSSGQAPQAPDPPQSYNGTQTGVAPEPSRGYRASAANAAVSPAPPRPADSTQSNGEPQASAPAAETGTSPADGSLQKSEKEQEPDQSV